VAKRKRLPIPTEPVLARVEAFDARGRGIATVDERRVHLANALPGELVRFRYLRRARRTDDGVVECVLEPAAHRVSAGCAHFDVCGGCRAQHIDPEYQIAEHEQSLLDALVECGVIPTTLAPALRGPMWGYRRRARLAARLVPKKGGVLVGFREKASNYVAQMSACEVLVPEVGHAIDELRELIGGLSVAAQIPQIEVAAGDNAAALIFRHLAPLSEPDCRALGDFAKRSGLRVLLQPGGLNTVHALDPSTGARAGMELSYRLDQFDLTLDFLPVDFIQINAAVNREMVGQAYTWLAPHEGERVLDLFCGLGNFSLPLARSGAHVLGLEGEIGLVHRASANATSNTINNAQFEMADLFDVDVVRHTLRWGPDKVLLDPPRSGAQALCAALADLTGPRPRRVVYVSCSPETFVRDAAHLVAGGYALTRTGIVDMFPHTGHVETMGQFDLA
jgi:23S rRNA (uracil1939-C5)-methyltransferase